MKVLFCCLRFAIASAMQQIELGLTRSSFPTSSSRTRSNRIFVVFAVVSYLLLTNAAPSWSQEDGEAVGTVEAAGEGLPAGEIETAVANYQAAFNAGDANAFSQLWSADPVYIITSTGERFRGREAIAALFASVREQEGKQSQLALEIQAIEFVSPHVALVNGNAVVHSEEQEVPLVTAFRSVYVKQADQWLLDRVSEEENPPAPPSHYEYLRSLEWMIGEWVDEEGTFSIEMSCEWTANQNFISRKFSATDADGLVTSGLQIIGWDAKQERIRSWLFDSDGVVVTGTWQQSQGSWKVQSVATLGDGATASFTSIFTPLENGDYRWRRIDQVVDGQLLPNVDEVVVRRR